MIRKQYLILVIMLVVIGCGKDEDDTSGSSGSASVSSSGDPSQDNGNAADSSGSGSSATKNSAFVMAPNGTLKSKIVTVSSYNNVYDEPNSNSDKENCDPFTIFYQLKPGGSGSADYYRVGTKDGTPIGWIHKTDAVEWTTRFALAPRFPSEFNSYEDPKPYFYMENAKGLDGIGVDPENDNKLVVDKTPSNELKGLILEKPAADLGDDTEYNILFLDREVGKRKEKAPFSDVTIEIVFVIEATDIYTAEQLGVKRKELIHDLFSDVVALFKGENVSELIRFGIVAYYDNNDGAARKGAKIHQELTFDHQKFLSASASLQGTKIGGDYAEDALSGIERARTDMNWSNNSSKHIVLCGFGAYQKYGRGKYPGASPGNNLITEMFNRNNSKNYGYNATGTNAEKIIDDCRGDSSTEKANIKTVHAILLGQHPDVLLKAMTPDGVDIANMDKVLAAGAEVTKVVLDNPQIDNATLLLALNGAAKQLSMPTELLLKIMLLGQHYKEYSEQFIEAESSYQRMTTDVDYPGFFESSTSNPTKEKYRRIAQNLYEEFGESVELLKAAQSGDPKAVKAASEKFQTSGGAFTRGSFSLITGQAASDAIGETCYVGTARTHNTNGIAIARKQVFVTKGELQTLQTRLNSMWRKFEAKKSRKDRADIGSLLKELQQYASSSVTGETITEDTVLEKLITDLPLKTPALKTTVKDLAGMPRDNYESWLDALKQSERDCQNLIEEDFWKDSAAGEQYRFVKLNQMP
jgi:hypothetical protein